MFKFLSIIIVIMLFFVSCTPTTGTGQDTITIKVINNLNQDIDSGRVTFEWRSGNTVLKYVAKKFLTLQKGGSKVMSFDVAGVRSMQPVFTGSPVESTSFMYYYNIADKKSSEGIWANQGGFKKITEIIPYFEVINANNAVEIKTFPRE